MSRIWEMANGSSIKFKMSDQEALTLVLALANWAVNRFPMSTKEYAEANEAIRIMEDIWLEG